MGGRERREEKMTSTHLARQPERHAVEEAEGAAVLGGGLVWVGEDGRGQSDGTQKKAHRIPLTSHTVAHVLRKPR